MTRSVYLDCNATVPVRPEAAAAVASALGACGNPSSVHGVGRAARRSVEDARDAVAALIGAPRDGIVFTSGATEANAMALGAASGRRLIVSAVEHLSVLENAKASGVRVSILPVDKNGVVVPGALARDLAADPTLALVSVMLANNETGVLQPVAEIARIAHGAGALVHTDAAQAVGRVPVDMAALGVDYLSLSAHKLGGPMGVGALAIAPGIAARPLIRGGAQEGRLRGGTENVPGIAGFAAAARLARADFGLVSERRELRDRMEAALLAVDPGATIFGAAAPRLWNTTLIAMPGVKAETQVIALDLAGVAVSAGAACSSGKVARSHVLDAMGVEARLAETAIRVSLGWANTDDDIRRLTGAWIDIRNRTRTRAAA